MACALAWQSGVGSLFRPGRDYKNDSAGIAGKQTETNLGFDACFSLTRSSFGLGIASIFVFSGVFSMTYGPVSWVYQSEVFSMPLRAVRCFHFGSAQSSLG